MRRIQVGERVTLRPIHGSKATRMQVPIMKVLVLVLVPEQRFEVLSPRGSRSSRLEARLKSPLSTSSGAGSTSSRPLYAARVSGTTAGSGASPQDSCSACRGSRTISCGVS